MFAQFSVFFLMSFVLPLISKSQNQDWVIHGGICTTLGTHQKNLGFTLRGYIQASPFIQLNGEITSLYHYKHYSGKRGIGFRTSIGALYAFGKTDISKREFLSVTNHQTPNEYALGYAFHYYGNNFRTSQRSGSITAHIHNWAINLENDVFGGGGKDRFRTSALSVTFQKDNFQYSLQNTLWTGDTQGAMRVKDSLYPARFGYLDMENQPFGKTSAGVLAFKINYAWNFGQTLQTNVGIDSERIRNFFQNKLLHDMYFVPQSWIRAENAHVPMINDKNEMYLYKPNQKIRPAQFFGNISFNQTSTYE